jgi:hypothetical protein
MNQASSALQGTEFGSSTIVLRQLATRFRTMSEREHDPRLRFKLGEMAADYERQAKLQEA